MFKKTSFAIMLLASVNASAQGDYSIPSGSDSGIDLTTDDSALNIHDCSHDELVTYIQKSTVSLGMPTPLVAPKEFLKAQEEKDKANGVEDCGSIFTDMKNIELPSFSDLAGSFDISGAAKKAASSIADTAAAYKDKLISGICERSTSEYLKDKAGDVADDVTRDKYGTPLSRFDPSEEAWNQVGERIGVEGYLIDPDNSNKRDNQADRDVDDALDEVDDRLWGRRR